MTTISNQFGGTDTILGGHAQGPDTTTIRTTHDGDQRTIVVFHGWLTAYVARFDLHCPEPIFLAALAATSQAEFDRLTGFPTFAVTDRRGRTVRVSVPESER